VSGAYPIVSTAAADTCSGRLWHARMADELNLTGLVFNGAESV
jgi:hypothetical protein